MKESWFPGKLATLDEAECRELLARTDIGRVGWSETIGPVIVPVNYAVDDEGNVRFRTAPHTALARHVAAGPLSFQIDYYDSFSQSAWSVLVRGDARCVSEPAGGLREQPEPWIGDRHLNVCLTPLVITGRRIIPT